MATTTEDNRDMISGHMPDEFDRALGVLDGLPDVTKTRPSTVRDTPPLGVGGTKTFIVQTVRQKEIKINAKGEDVARGRDTIFLEAFGAQGAVRLVIPPAVADIIARQSEALTGITRSKTAKRVAQDRKDRGEQLGNPEALRKARAKRSKHTK